MTSSQRFRIAYLISKYPDFSHTFILREVLALRDLGFEVEPASINAAPPADRLTQIERDEAARTFYVKKVGVAGVVRAKFSALIHQPLGLFRGLGFALKLGSGDVRQLMLCFFYYLEALILAKWMRDRSLSHVHVHFATPAATVALILTHVAPVTFSMTVHGSDEFYNVNLYFLAEKLEAAQFVVCISWFAQSQLMKLTPGRNWGKFDVARLGVDCDRFMPRQVSRLPAEFHIVCVGRLVSAKGQRVLIESVARLIENGRMVHLDLVGDGPDRADLEALAQESHLGGCVVFAGTVNQDHIQRYYERAHAFVLPSFAEGIPVVLMEAMAMEIPCVSTRITGIPELIEDGVDGLLVAPSDVEGLTDAIARLMDSAELRSSLGQAGRRKVLREYELSANVAHLRDVFARRLELPR